MSMERAIMRDMGGDCYNAVQINKILTRIGQGSIKEGVMLLSYAGIPIYLVSRYDMNQIYQTIIECKYRGGDSIENITYWLYSQPIDSGIRDRLIKNLKKCA